MLTQEPKIRHILTIKKPILTNFDLNITISTTWNDNKPNCWQNPTFFDNEKRQKIALQSSNYVWSESPFENYSGKQYINVSRSIRTIKGKYITFDCITFASVIRLWLLVRASRVLFSREFRAVTEWQSTSWFNNFTYVLFMTAGLRCSSHFPDFGRFCFIFNSKYLCRILLAIALLVFNVLGWLGDF